MEWDLLDVQELPTKAHDMEMTIANDRGKVSSPSEAREDKGDFKKNSKVHQELIQRIHVDHYR